MKRTRSGKKIPCQTIAPSAIVTNQAPASPGTPRVFKTKGFARSTRRARITDRALCVAIREVMRGQADNLGGGVWKQRLGQNRERAIILAKGGRRWVCEFLFSKQNREGISDSELAGFRRLAAAYATLGETVIAAMLTNGDWTEICHDSEGEVQE